MPMSFSLTQMLLISAAYLAAGFLQTAKLIAIPSASGETRQQVQRIEAAKDTTSSIAKSHKHQGHRKWVAQR